MFTAKLLAYRIPHVPLITGGDHQVQPGALLALEMVDKNGVEYHDGDIVKTSFQIGAVRYPMLGFIRYSCGRFEVRCPWADQGFVVGLNPTHEIIGNMTDDPDANEAAAKIVEQIGRKFNREGGFKA